MISKSPIADLTDHLGYRLRQVSNQVSTAFARRIEGEGVTVAEWVVLRILYDTKGLAPSRLAARLGMTRGAISKLADRLLAKGLVARTDSPDDARAHTLALSSRGRHLVPRLAALADANDTAFFGVLDAGERARLEALLAKLVEQHGLQAPPLE